MISRIYHHGPADAPTGAEAEHRNHAAYQQAWQRYGLFIVDPATIADDWVRQAVVNEANKRYLKRAGDGR